MSTTLAKGTRVAITVTGLENVIEALRALNKKAVTPALKRGGRVASTVVLKTARALAPKKKLVRRQRVLGQTGLLRAALGSKVGVNQSTGAVYALVGVRRGKQFHGTAVHPRTGKIVKVKPTKYAHLVEFGFNLKLRNGKIKRVAGKSFLRRAYDANKNRIAQLMRESLFIAIQKANENFARSTGITSALEGSE